MQFSQLPPILSTSPLLSQTPGTKLYILKSSYSHLAVELPFDETEGEQYNQLLKQHITIALFPENTCSDATKSKALHTLRAGTINQNLPLALREDLCKIHDSYFAATLKDNPLELAHNNALLTAHNQKLDRGTISSLLNPAPTTSKYDVLANRSTWQAVTEFSFDENEDSDYNELLKENMRLVLHPKNKTDTVTIYAFKTLVAGINNKNLPLPLRENLCKIRDSYLFGALNSSITDISSDPLNVLRAICCAWGANATSDSNLETFKSTMNASKVNTLAHFTQDPEQTKQATIEFNNIVLDKLVSTLPVKLQTEYHRLRDSDFNYEDKKAAIFGWCAATLRQTKFELAHQDALLKAHNLKFTREIANHERGYRAEPLEKPQQSFARLTSYAFHDYL